MKLPTWRRLAVILYGLAVVCSHSRADDRIVPYITETGIFLLWVSAIITLYTGYDYFRAGLRHIDN